MWKQIFNAVCLWLIVLSPLTGLFSVNAEAATNTLSLRHALDLANQGNPGLAEMQARAKAMAAVPSQAGSLPDPVISIGLANLPTDSFSTSQEAMTQWQLGVTQAIPYPGKLSLRKQIAQQLADAADADTQETRLHLDRDVKTLWWRLFYLDRALEVVGINKTLLRQFVDIAETKYKVGQGLQQDVLLAQLELSKLLDREIALKSKRKQEAARLNALLARSPDTPIQLPAKNAISFNLPKLKTRMAVLAIAKTNRPELAQQRLKIAAAETQKQLAERDLLPDFDVTAAYGLRQGNNMNGTDRADLLSLKVGIHVPLFAEHKQKMAISQRNSELRQQQFAYQDKWLSIQKDISNSMTRYQQARDQHTLLTTGIIPQAQQTVASMLAGYQVDKVDFLNLIRTQITLYNYETTMWESVSEAKAAIADLIANVGEEDIYE